MIVNRNGRSNFGTRYFNFKAYVNDHGAKAGGLLLRLKAGSIGYSADLNHLKVIVGLRSLLILDVLLPDVVGRVAARRHPVASGPEVLASVTLLQTPELR